MNDLAQWVVIFVLALALYRNNRSALVMLDHLTKWMNKQEEINREVAKALKGRNK